MGAIRSKKQMRELGARVEELKTDCYQQISAIKAELENVLETLPAHTVEQVFDALGQLSHNVIDIDNLVKAHTVERPKQVSVDLVRVEQSSFGSNGYDPISGAEQYSLLR